MPKSAVKFLYLVASISEFTASATRSAAGFPYLTYGAGEVSVILLYLEAGVVLSSYVVDLQCHRRKGRIVGCKKTRTIFCRELVGFEAITTKISFMDHGIAFCTPRRLRMLKITSGI